MPFQLSPGVLVTEKDLTSIIPAVSTSRGAFAGVFPWGPVLDPTTISSETELVSLFGKPQDANATSFFTAANFLAYTNNLLTTRVDTQNHRNAVAAPTGQVTAVTFTSGGTGYPDATVTFSAPPTGGTLATGTATVVNGVITGITVTNGGQGYVSAPTCTITSSSAPTSTISGISVTYSTVGIKINNRTIYDSYYIGGNGIVGLWAAKYPGTLGNSLKVEMCDAGGYATWAYKGEFTGAPGTSAYAAASNTSAGDELHVVVIDEDGAWTGIKNAVLEKFAFLSKASDARRADGSNQFYKDVINDTSKYVYWMDYPTVANLIGTGGENWGVTMTTLGTGTFLSLIHI